MDDTLEKAVAHLKTNEHFLRWAQELREERSRVLVQICAAELDPNERLVLIGRQNVLRDILQEFDLERRLA